MTYKELKRTLRELNKLKKQTKVGTEERRDIVKNIRELKTKLNETTEGTNKQNTDSEKETIIKEILELNPKLYDIKTSDWCLEKFTKEQLQKHLNKLKEKNDQKTN